MRLHGTRLVIYQPACLSLASIELACAEGKVPPCNYYRLTLHAKNSDTYILFYTCYCVQGVNSTCGYIQFILRYIIIIIILYYIIC